MQQHEIQFAPEPRTPAALLRRRDGRFVLSAHQTPPRTLLPTALTSTLRWRRRRGFLPEAFST
jgi:hypothetical protein